jgi:hypothetical protein
MTYSAALVLLRLPRRSSMSLRHVHGRTVTEGVSDVTAWLRGLTGCPPITDTTVVGCSNHGDEPATWFYVEADAAAGVGRVRCLACGRVQHLLDSEQHWTFPPTWSCENCEQSIAEVAVGGHAAHGSADHPDWIAVAVRCVECGTVEGLTDAVVPPGSSLGDVFAATPVTA